LLIRVLAKLGSDALASPFDEAKAIVSDEFCKMLIIFKGFKIKKKKIAFDLDDTLIPTTTTFSVGSQKAPFPLNLFFKEELRVGTIALMKELSYEYALWIYTTSLRSEFYLKVWFYSMGVKLEGIVNVQIHKEA